VLERFLEIENNEALYNYTFLYKNTMMYPFVRFLLLQSALEESQGMSSPYDSLYISIRHKVEYVVKSFFYRPKNNQSDIVFFGSDISNIRQGNAYFNRLTESFANEYMSKTVLIESANKMNYKRPRTYSKVFARNFITISARIRSVLTSVKNEDEKQIDEFVEYLKQCFSYRYSNNDIWNTVKRRLLSIAKELSSLNKGYSKLLKRIKPKIVFLEDACYGDGSVPLIMAARELGISIGEYQHGLISLTHPSYNYSVHLSEKYKYYMPDFYMSYGRYWEGNSCIPIKVFEVGNPYLSETTSHYECCEKRKMILYVSSAINPELYVREVIQLKERLMDKGCELVFRIHPSETLRLQTVYKPIIDAGIPIDTQPLYERLKNTKYLFGDFSTVLFEASVFDCVIFVRDTPYNQSNMDITRFNAVQSIDEVVDKIVFQEYQKTDCRDFWADDWKSRYRKIIDSYVSCE
jgi:hypothetical protein